jgi:hypothetical protein
MVVAMMALFVALSGSAVALQGRNKVDKNDIRKDAVRSKQVKNENLKGIDLKDGTVLGADVGDGSLTEADLAANSVDSSEIADNAVKSSEIANNAVGSPQIDDNAVGASDVKGIYAAVTGVNAPTANTYVDGSSSCNQGDAVLGGGFSWLDPNAEIHTNYSTPDPLTDPNRWIVRSKSSTANDTLFTWAVCLGA